MESKKIRMPAGAIIACILIIPSKEALASAEKAYDIAVKSYQLGKSTLTDLNNTELTLTQSRLAVSQAIYNFVIAKAGLEQTLGYDFNEN